jgi:[ribosomal protein S5]-alanine N-acetyltransferase
LVLAILEEEKSEFLGLAGLHNIKSKTPEIGIWIKKSAHGNKYGLEAITAFIHWAKTNIDYTHLRYPVDKRNIASRRIPEMNGGIIMKEYKKINQRGFELDEVEYWIYK